MDLLRKLIEHLATDLRAEDGPPGPDVVVDLHAERVQEPPQTITCQRVQVDLGMRQLSEQIRVLLPLRRRCGEVPPQLRVQPCPFVLQLGHAGAGPREKLPVGVVGSFQDAHEVVHAALLRS